jgi:hypothetical protein
MHENTGSTNLHSERGGSAQELHQRLVAASRSWWWAWLKDDQNGMTDAANLAKALRSQGASEITPSERIQILNGTLIAAKHDWWSARLALNKTRMSQLQAKADHLRSQGASTSASEDASINRQYEAAWRGKMAEARAQIHQAQRDWWLAWLDDNAGGKSQAESRANAVRTSLAGCANSSEFEPTDADLKQILHEVLIRAKHAWWSARLKLNKKRMDHLHAKAEEIRNNRRVFTTPSEDEAINQQYAPSWERAKEGWRATVLEHRKAYWSAWRRDDEPGQKKATAGEAAFKQQFEGILLGHEIDPSREQMAALLHATLLEFKARWYEASLAQNLALRDQLAERIHRLQTAGAALKQEEEAELQRKYGQHAQQAPVISAHSVTDVYEAGALVRWTTDRQANSWVNLTQGRAFGREERVTEHEVELTGLSPSTTYSGQIRCKVAEGAPVATRDISFTTPALPRISNVKAEDTSQGLQVSWTTDRRGDSWVSVANKSFGQDDHVQQHQVIVTGLDRQKPLQGQVLTKSRKGAPVATAIFTVEPVKQPHPLRLALQGIGLDPDQAPVPGSSLKFITLLEEQPILRVQDRGPGVQLLQLIYRKLGFQIPDALLGAYNNPDTYCATRALMAYCGVDWVGNAQGRDSDVGPIMWPRIIELITRLGKMPEQERVTLRRRLLELQAEKKRLLPAPAAPAKEDERLLRTLAPQEISALRKKYYVQSPKASAPMLTALYRQPKREWLSVTPLNFVSYLQEHFSKPFIVKWRSDKRSVDLTCGQKTDAQVLHEFQWMMAYFTFVDAVAPLQELFEPGALKLRLKELDLHYDVLKQAVSDNRSRPSLERAVPGTEYRRGSIFLVPAALAGMLVPRMELEPSGPLERAARAAAVLGAYAVLVNEESFDHVSLTHRASNFFVALSDMVGVPPPPVEDSQMASALTALRNVKDAYLGTLPAAEEKEDVLRRQLRRFYRALTPNQVSRYSAAFRAAPKHKQPFQLQLARANQLSSVLAHRRPELQQAARASQENARLLYEALKALASSPAPKTVVAQYLRDMAITGSDLQVAFRGFPALVEEIAMPAIAGLALPLDDELLAWERLRELIDSFMSAKDHVSGFGDIVSGWKELNGFVYDKRYDALPDKAREWAQKGRGSKLLALIAILYSLESGVANLQSQRYEAAIKDLASGSMEGMEVLACVLKTMVDKGRFAQATTKVAAAAKLASRVAPFLGAAASAASFCVTINEKNKNAGTNVALVGDVISLIGSVALCFPGLQVPGGLAVAIGVVISTVGGLLSEVIKNDQEKAEVLSYLKAAGITDEKLARTMLELSQHNVEAFLLTDYGPENLQVLATRYPPLLTGGVNLAPLQRLAKAFSMDFQSFLRFLEDVSRGAKDPYEALRAFAYAHAFEGPSPGEVTMTRERWRKAIRWVLSPNHQPPPEGATFFIPAVILSEDERRCLERALELLK